MRAVLFLPAGHHIHRRRSRGTDERVRQVDRVHRGRGRRQRHATRVAIPPVAPHRYRESRRTRRGPDPDRGQGRGADTDRRADHNPLSRRPRRRGRRYLPPGSRFDGSSTTALAWNRTPVPARSFEHTPGSTARRRIRWRRLATPSRSRTWTCAWPPRREKRSRRRCPAAADQNPYCASFAPKEADTSENAQSLGSVITFGKFRMVHLGDLTWNKEFELTCPANPIGKVDLLMVSHHGFKHVKLRSARPQPGAAGGDHEQRHPEGRHAGHDADHLLVTEPRGSLAASFLATGGPGVRRARAVHRQRTRRCRGRRRSARASADRPRHTAHAGARARRVAYWIKVSAQATGAFTVANSRNGFSKTYAARTGR